MAAAVKTGKALRVKSVGSAQSRARSGGRKRRYSQTEAAAAVASAFELTEALRFAMKELQIIGAATDKRIGLPRGYKKFSIMAAYVSEAIMNAKLGKCPFDCEMLANPQSRVCKAIRKALWRERRQIKRAAPALAPLELERELRLERSEVHHVAWFIEQALREVSGRVVV